MAWGREPTASLLMEGETLLWSGRPKQGLMFTSRDWVGVPFSLVWCGFAVAWTIGARAMEAPWFFSAFGLIFVAVGLYMVFGRFVHDAWLRSRDYYAVTDERVLAFRGGVGGHMRALDIDRLPELTLEDMRPDGRGTLRFERPHMVVRTHRRRSRSTGVRRDRTYAQRDDQMLPAAGRALAFLQIADAQEAYRIVRDAARARGDAEPTAA